MRIEMLQIEERYTSRDVQISTLLETSIPRLLRRARITDHLLALHRNNHSSAAAAVDYGCSPATISLSLKRAEEILNYVIYDREERPMVPTEFGIWLLKFLQDLRQQEKKLIKTAGYGLRSNKH